jgi:hypothetical protein
MAPTTIQLDPAAAKALADHAAILGLTVEEYLRKHFAGTNSESIIEDADAWLDELSDGLDMPALPLDFSTKDIYADHD